MALEAETVSRRLFLAADGEGELSAGTVPPVLLSTEKNNDRLVDEVLWGDEQRMKRELVAWAKAVASMAAATTSKNTTSSPSSPWLSMRRRG